MRINKRSQTRFTTALIAFLLTLILVLLPVTGLQVTAHFDALPRLQEITATVETAAAENTPTPTPTVTSMPLPAATEEIVQVPGPAAADPTLATLNGTVTFQGYPAPPNSLTAAPLQLTLLIPGNTNPAFQYQLTTDENGNLSQTDIPPGTYHLQLKHANHLPALQWNIILTAGENIFQFGMLKAGDANNDSFVSATDFSLLSASYGKCTGQPGFDARSDFNADGCITAVDFSLLSSNYGQGGTINPLPTPTPRPTLTPNPTPMPTSTPDIPPAAAVANIYGTNQSLPLNCESSAAVDWAGYYGTRINDVAFHNELPLTDNPDTGFVGNVYGVWGQIPPNPYGVHADPIAANLRNHGLPAVAVHHFAYQDLQRQIARGNPVIVWVIGHAWAGTPVQYTDSQGRTTTVARYQHTVMVIGYGPTSVTILDGNTTYQRSLDAFFGSWGVLGNMAVIHE
ncbi:MAG: C39 family peptidase [Anaerolineaceae bacterium]|jgi:uncharacterized protein YvpB|nr:C39 family peptidase [Anaerolineaceae bacterium]